MIDILKCREVDKSHWATICDSSSTPVIPSSGVVPQGTVLSLGITFLLIRKFWFICASLW